MDRIAARFPSAVSLAAALAIPLAVAAAPPAAATEGWPGLRGPNLDGAVRDVKLLDEERPGLSVAWKRALGSGYSAVIVADGRALTMFADGADDVLAAFDVETGERLWRYRIAETYAGHDGSHDGPIATPTVAGGRVFGFGPRGHLFAVDAATGAEVWSVDVAEAHGAEAPFYGFSASPVVADGVVVHLLGAGEGKAIAGFSAADGKLLWTAGDDSINYQSPVVIRLGGRDHVVAAGDKILHGLDAKSGELLWTWDMEGDERAMGSGSVVPVPAGENRFFVMNRQDRGTMLRVTRSEDGKEGKAGGAWNVEVLWTDANLKASYVSPVYHDGHLYGMNNRILTCVKAETGERVWRSREPGDGFPTLVGEHLVIITKDGGLHVAEASPEGYKEVAQVRLFDDHSWSEVAFADGSLYARSMGEIARIDPVLRTASEAGVSAESAAASEAAAVAAANASAGAVAPTPVPDGAGLDVGDGGFAAFLRRVAEAPDAGKSAIVDAWFAEQASFPVVEPPDRVHFVYRGEASDVGIVGDMIGFRREDPMHRVPGTDVFHYSMRLEPDASVSYGFLVDYGDATADPRNDRPGPGLWGEVSRVTMPARRDPSWLAGALAERQGTLVDLTWDSEILPAPVPQPEEPAEDEEGEEGEEGEAGEADGGDAAPEPQAPPRRARVYLPAGFDPSGATRYPTVYVNGGDSALEDGSLKEALDGSIGVTVRPLIAVFILPPEGGDPRSDTRDTEVYARMLEEELVPKVDATYPTLADARARGIVGAAGGANAALAVAFTNPGTFGLAGSLGAVADATQADPFLRPASEAPVTLYLQWGTYHIRSPHEAWDLAEGNREIWKVLRERGHRPTGGETPDGFGWVHWRDHAGAMLGTLFPAPRSAATAATAPAAAEVSPPAGSAR